MNSYIQSAQDLATWSSYDC